jgi:hypothetical protein
MVKFCKFDLSKRCFHFSCGFLDDMGNVQVCSLFRGSDMFTSRKVKRAFQPLWNKHLRGGF